MVSAQLAASQMEVQQYSAIDPKMASWASREVNSELMASWGLAARKGSQIGFGFVCYVM